MIGNLQALRGLAAIGVVFYHTGYLPFGAPRMHTDFGGVATFFVISGFIMCFITERDHSRFVERRLVRIMPMWLISLMVGAVLFQRPNLDTWMWLLQSAFLIPTERGLGVGWTLNLEMYFYAIFAAALSINARLAPLLAAFALVAVFVAASLFPGSPLLDHYAHIFVYYFLGGIALFYALRTAPAWRIPGAAAIAIAAAIYGWILMRPAVEIRSAALDWSYLATPVALVALALVTARSGRDIAWRPLLLLGDASYSIYLAHTLVMEWIFRHGVPREFAATASGSFAMIAICTAAGVAVHLLVEKPVDRAIRLWLQYRRSEQPAPRIAPAE